MGVARQPENHLFGGRFFEVYLKKYGLSLTSTGSILIMIQGLVGSADKLQIQTGGEK